MRNEIVSKSNITNMIQEQWTLELRQEQQHRKMRNKWIPEEKNKNIFILPDEHAVKSKDKLTLRHKLRKGAFGMNVTPGVHTSLIIVCQIADEGYVTVFDENECNIYDGKKVKIVISEKSVLKGYRCKNSGLWRIPLKDTILNENMDTIIIDRPNLGESISHIFELPSTENTIKYMHAAAGLRVKETCIRAV